jgi:hypothetical protein
VALLPLGDLMDMANEIADGQPLLPRLANVAEWLHWKPDPRVERGELQTLVYGAHLFLSAAQEPNPFEYLQTEGRREHLRRGELPVAELLLKYWKGVPIGDEPTDARAVGTAEAPSAVRIPSAETAPASTAVTQPQATKAPTGGRPKGSRSGGLSRPEWRRRADKIIRLRKQGVIWDAIPCQVGLRSVNQARDWMKERMQELASEAEAVAPRSVS